MLRTESAWRMAEFSMYARARARSNSSVRVRAQCCVLNISLFSCALFLSCPAFLPSLDPSFLPLLSRLSSAWSPALPPPLLGLRLDSRVFFDLDSDLEVPRMTLLIFWTVLSVMDSVLDSLGDLAWPDAGCAASACTLALSPAARGGRWPASSFFSSRNEPDFLTLLPGEAEPPPPPPPASLDLAPSSEDRFLQALLSGLDLAPEPLSELPRPLRRSLLFSATAWADLKWAV